MSASLISLSVMISVSSSVSGLLHQVKAGIFERDFAAPVEGESAFDVHIRAF